MFGRFIFNLAIENFEMESQNWLEPQTHTQKNIMLKLAILLTLLLILTVYGIYHSFLNRDIDIALLFSENSIVTLREYVNFKHAIKLVDVNIILNFLIPLLSFSAFFIGIKDNPNLKK